MHNILQTIYYLGVYIALGNVAKLKGLSFAIAFPKQENVLSATNLRHPCIEKAIGNKVSINKEGNVIFLTGANMAGKSTFMKSFGIAVHLALMGFPVAAGEITFSVKDSLYSSINVPDDLSLGYSHFYAEVLRVRGNTLPGLFTPFQHAISFLFIGRNARYYLDFHFLKCAPKMCASCVLFYGRNKNAEAINLETYLKFE